jgi:hypothetical protein
MKVFRAEKEGCRDERRSRAFEEDVYEEFRHLGASSGSEAGSSAGRLMYHRFRKNGRLYIEDDISSATLPIATCLSRHFASSSWS